jgi:hypothetical protein
MGVKLHYIAAQLMRTYIVICIYHYGMFFVEHVANRVAFACVNMNLW